jgi:hypothetical protein
MPREHSTIKDDVFSPSYDADSRQISPAILRPWECVHQKSVIPRFRVNILWYMAKKDTTASNFQRRSVHIKGVMPLKTFFAV